MLVKGTRDGTWYTCRKLQSVSIDATDETFIPRVEVMLQGNLHHIKIMFNVQYHRETHICDYLGLY